MNATVVTTQSGAGLAIERIVDAPRELVWQAWTDPAHLAQWWLPEGGTAPHCSIDQRSDGRLVVYSSAPEHGEALVAGVLYEVDPPHELVYGDYVTDSVSSSAFSVSRLTSVTFEDLGDGRTKVTLR
jgi:uncharacterized protein YndB with AHSA1/START domain